MQVQMLGQILLEGSLINEEQLQQALDISKRTRARIGDVVISEGMLTYLDLYKAVAKHYQLDFINLLTLEPDKKLLNEDMAESYLQMRAMPYMKHNGITTIVTAEISTAVYGWATAHYGRDIQFAITSPVDIQRTVQKLFHKKLTHKSTLQLFEAHPHASARKKTPTQKRLYIAFVMLVLGAIISLLTQQLTVMCVAFCYSIYGLSMLFKIAIYLGGLWQSRHKISNDYLHINDQDLPVYTVLVPMYKETESIAKLMQAMQNMNYPAAKMDVKLVLENDDTATIEAAKALKPSYQFDIIIVPKSAPRTKPKACNYALRFAKGDFVTVYDADDQPDRNQLRKAVYLFRNAPDNVICLQARLNYYNAHDNWLTRCFSLEYAMLFNVMLHGVSLFKMPVLLGGTSNHIALAKLRALGEWDPYNVTEDADLGARLAAHGYQTWMLDSDTLEEAPNTLHAWLKQRSRWIKGYIQTWVVHMRSPATLLKSYKLHGFLGFQCFVAMASFSYLTAPIMWLVALLWLINPVSFIPEWLFILASANLVLNFLVHIVTATHSAWTYPSRCFALSLCALTYPFYLLLHSIASYISLYQFFVKPYFWDKTKHGEARTFEDISFG
jgi:cellulose synthase/poly-beta-1,6-N-acetylglucosamine synthase-like glycosyltransferase